MPHIPESNANGDAGRPVVTTIKLCTFAANSLHWVKCINKLDDGGDDPVATNRTSVPLAMVSVLLTWSGWHKSSEYTIRAIVWFATAQL